VTGTGITVVPSVPVDVLRVTDGEVLDTVGAEMTVVPDGPVIVVRLALLLALSLALVPMLIGTGTTVMPSEPVIVLNETEAEVVALAAEGAVVVDTFSVGSAVAFKDDAATERMLERSAARELVTAGFVAVAATLESLPLSDAAKLESTADAALVAVAVAPVWPEASDCIEAAAEETTLDTWESTEESTSDAPVEAGAGEGAGEGADPDADEDAEGEEARTGTTPVPAMLEVVKVTVPLGVEADSAALVLEGATPACVELAEAATGTPVPDGTTLEPDGLTPAAAVLLPAVEIVAASDEVNVTTGVLEAVLPIIVDRPMIIGPELDEEVESPLSAVLEPLKLAPVGAGSDDGPENPDPDGRPSVGTGLIGRLAERDEMIWLDSDCVGRTIGKLLKPALGRPLLVGVTISVAMPLDNAAEPVKLCSASPVALVAELLAVGCRTMLGRRPVDPPNRSASPVELVAELLAVGCKTTLGRRPVDPPNKPWSAPLVALVAELPAVGCRITLGRRPVDPPRPNKLPRSPSPPVDVLLAVGWTIMSVEPPVEATNKEDEVLLAVGWTILSVGPPVEARNAVEDVLLAVGCTTTLGIMPVEGTDGAPRSEAERVEERVASAELLEEVGCTTTLGIMPVEGTDGAPRSEAERVEERVASAELLEEVGCTMTAGMLPVDACWGPLKPSPRRVLDEAELAAEGLVLVLLTGALLATA
jgi:hypothetical protein